MPNNLESTSAISCFVNEGSHHSRLVSLLRTSFNLDITELIIIALLALAFYACLRVLAHRRAQRYTKNPKTWPLLGSQLEASRNYDRLLDWTTSFFTDDHRTIKMTFLSRRSYYTVDPANVEHILKTNFENYPKGGESHYRLFDLLGNGILNTDGNMWRMHRKLASLEFSVKKLRRLTSSVYKKNALKLLDQLITSNREVDVQELLLHMTFQSICEVAFGSVFDPERDCTAEAGSIPVALDNAQEMITRRYMYPWWKINKFLGIGSERVFREDMTKFNNFLMDMIEKKESQMQNEVECRDSDYAPVQDLLSRFLWAQEKTSQQDILASRKSKQMIKDAMMNFVLAGRDTTESTLSWFLYCMCIYPDKQEKIFEELVKLENLTLRGNGNNNEIDVTARSYSDENGEVAARSVREAGQMFVNANTSELNEYERNMFNLSRKVADEVLIYENLHSNSLPYLHSALAETLRLYPAVPRDGKVALNADILPDGTRLRAGDQVAYIPYAMGRMQFLWGPDASSFNPERWIRDGCFQPQSPFKFTAFQAGPRMCLGKDAAYLQMKLTAALLIRFFRFELVPNHPVEYRMMNVMTMKHGLRVNVTVRKINQEV
ncbi:hypothetical protein KP509_25G036200 [Ceratopteris richardii]|uniref:Cytochrome P450 n=1 Tax=Ceratopteris richardii TaxID=49495 RepID=A0A8T2RS05_CERRI|nr:hypothetical protein KP509_25G036200 [Ceratopteris richardii]